MEPLKLHSLDAEECLVAALLLQEPDYTALELFTDDDVFYEHIRPVLSAIRTLHARGKPISLPTVTYALEPILDSLSWRGDVGEVMLVDLLGRRMLDPCAWSARAMAGIIHAYAERRKAMTEAQEAAKRTFNEVLDAARARYEGELG